MTPGGGCTDGPGHYRVFILGGGDHVHAGLPAAEIPVPDDGTLKCVESLRQQGKVAEDEGAFLAYFELLERLRAALQREGSQ